MGEIRKLAYSFKKVAIYSQNCSLIFYCLVEAFVPSSTPILILRMSFHCLLSKSTAIYLNVKTKWFYCLFSVKSKCVFLSYLAIWFYLTFLDSIKLWMNTNQYFCNRIFFLIHPASQNGWSLTNSCKLFKNKTLPARQFHIWELGFTSHILAWEIKFPHSQKTNGNPTLLFLSGGSQSMYPITTLLWVHVHLRTFPHLALYLYFSFHIIFHELIF